MRKFYGRQWRTETRPLILRRAGNKCEQCRVPDRERVARLKGCWLDGQHGYWVDEHGEKMPRPQLSVERVVRIILTVAHLDHTPGHDEETNLLALCQWCHLHLDKDQHKLSRCLRKDAARELLTLSSEVAGNL